MANVCDNDWYCTSENEENLKVIKEFIENEFYGELTYEDSTSLEGFFESRWVFPEEKMQELYELIPDKEDIYMRCLSVELGCLYHTLWICENEKGWTEV